MPIKDLSNSVRLPRLGKIHLGIKKINAKGIEYPSATDYFVLPKDHSDYAKLVAIFGEKPKELRILIPVEDAEQWATQYYKAYNQTYGLVCKGDGEVALRMVDSKTQELPDAKVSATVALKEIPCPGQECPDYQAKKCHEVMNLKFLIPEVPGLGVWQIDTGSKNSIININSCAKIIKRAFGRISLVPLKLTFEPAPVNNPETGKKQTIHVLNLRTGVTLAQLADQAKEQAKMFMIEAPDLEAVYDAQIEKDIDDLWGEKPIAEPEKEATKEPQPTVTPEEVEEKFIVEISDKQAEAQVEPPQEALGHEISSTQDEASAITSEVIDTTEKLLSWVAEVKAWKTSKYARSWLVSGPCRIVEKRIDEDPAGVYAEIKDVI